MPGRKTRLLLTPRRVRLEGRGTLLHPEVYLSVDYSPQLPALRALATKLRIDSLRITSTAGSGHPTSCCSAAEIMAALFFGHMRYDPASPDNPDNDRFVLSKGHAAPILYAAWAHAGVIDHATLESVRRISSDLEGHPTPRLPFVDVATGSLGQGICAAVGMALNARRIASPASRSSVRLPEVAKFTFSGVCF